jgi:CheY-like chemotaxis protein
LKKNLELMHRYDVSIQHWPEDALETAREFKPDLVMLDLIMPRMPGGNVVAAFEEDPELREVPIVFFTASVWRHQVEENDGIICGHACLAKPSHFEEIVQFIENNLPPHLRRQDPARTPAALAEALEEATPVSWTSCCLRSAAGTARGGVPIHGTG